MKPAFEFSCFELIGLILTGPSKALMPKKTLWLKEAIGEGTFSTLLGRLQLT
jgi:hypothetical protein